MLNLWVKKYGVEEAVRSGRGGRSMIWKTQAPTQGGWYWFSELDGSDERIVNVFHEGLDADRPLVVSGENFHLSDLNGHRWAGPIERPR